MQEAKTGESGLILMSRNCASDPPAMQDHRNLAEIY